MIDSSFSKLTHIGHDFDILAHFGRKKSTFLKLS